MEFTFIDTYGKFDCPNHLEKTDYQLMITPISVKLECRVCHKQYFYRIVRI